jgi:hypothetical protein
MKACPLCSTEAADIFYQDKTRDYFRCSACDLIFVAPEQHLSPEEEKSRYNLHQNSPDDKQYRTFLNRLSLPLQERIPAGSCGLDFGSGPGPTLSVMFEEAGYPMEIYDTFYAKDPAVLEKQYDFITATEVFEHLHNPEKELDRVWGCLKSGGWLGVMTKLARSREDFSKWHYKNDPTHVRFFSNQTFEWLADKWKAELIFADKDVILLRKKNRV